MKVEGSVERVTYHHPETGFSVLKVQVSGRRELLSVVGYTALIHTGELIEAEGEWVQDREYGTQFRASAIQVVPPTSLAGIERYLASGLIRGIGPHFAGRLVAHFGERILEVLDQDPEQLHQVPGLGEKRIEQVKTSWEQQKAVRSIMLFLQTYRLSPSKALRIYKVYGPQAVSKVRENPYRLAQDIPGIGFKSADALAQTLGIEKTSLVRARAGLSYGLLEATQKGHCAYPRSLLLKETSALLEIPEERLQEALDCELQEKKLILEPLKDQPCVFLASLHFYEKKIVDWLKIRLQNPGKSLPHLPPDPHLHPLQQEAIQKALQSGVCLITGGPGTGKSTLTRALVDWATQHGAKITLCSPTGRAAKRLAECTGREAKTLHRLLGWGSTPQNAPELPVEWLLIDESSMIDLPLFYQILKRLPLQAKLTLIGDPDQLPSVGPGKVLADLLACAIFPSIRLTQVFRQAAESQIIQAAHAIQQGRLPSLTQPPQSDFHFVESDEPEKTVARIVEWVSKRLPEKWKIDPKKDIQVLCPMQRGILGARHLNQLLQEALNPNPPQRVERFGYRFGLGDKVLVLANDYEKEVFNGDLGWVTRIDEEEKICEVTFEGRPVTFDWDELDLLQPAYTLTVHKAQGSEYPVVIFPIVMQHYLLLQRNLVYTALTRGKRKVLMIGQKKALAMAVRSVQKGERWTGLVERLKKSQAI